MTAGNVSHRPREPVRNETSRAYFEHSSAKRINTETVIVDALRKEYPQLHLTVVPRDNCDLIAFASAGNAGLARIDDEKDRLDEKFFLPPFRRLNGDLGILAESLSFGKFLLDWQGKEYITYVVDGRDGSEPWPLTNIYVLSPSIEASNRLLLAAGAWNNLLHEEVYVFDQGYWQKSAELYQSIMKSHWEDVILDKKMKDAIIADVENFFNSRETYERLHVNWKRGIIYHGPPGNGKTVSIKAMMHSLYSRKDPIPTLYVRSLRSFGGPEYSLNQIFSLARRYAPCYLVFEDLDSIVTDEVRSYFLNEVDGIKPNDGILMVGSTNHLDRLDPGIAKRPSRFDRKYLFPNPNEAEREQYMHYWQGKLADNEDLEFPDKLCPAVAQITDGFSFAYLQEAMVAALLAIAREPDDSAGRFCLECMESHGKAQGVSCDRAAHHPFTGLYDWVWKVRRVDEDDRDLDQYVLWRELKKQIRILREEMGDDKGGKGGKE